MPQRSLTQQEMIDALNIKELHGSWAGARDANVAGLLPRTTFMSRVSIATLAGLKPTVRKEAARVHSTHRLGRMHMVIPDTQTKHGVPLEHLEWAGNYAAEKKPDVIVHIGDHWDMPSLSSHDKGKRQAEGRRYVKDIDAGVKAMELFLAPIRAVPGYSPRMVFCMGNHEHRIVRLVDNNAELEGKVSLGDLPLKAMGWEVHQFLEVVRIDGIEYAHYFTSGVNGKAVSSAAAMLRERQRSCTMGHVQYTDMAIHKKTQNIALFSGTFYQHDEAYLGQQDNVQRRQIIIKHEVSDEGKYDPMFVSLEFLRKAYS